MRRKIVLPFFLIALALGYWLSHQAWNGRVYVYLGSERSPAAVRPIQDYSPIESSMLSKSAQNQLLADAELSKQDGYLGIHLGHVLLRGEGGMREFACATQGREGAYDRIELTFMGEGIAESEGPAKMIVDSKCESSDELSRLGTIWIPMQDILALKPKDQDLRSRGDNPTFIKMQAIPSQWPETWALYSVKLYSKSGGRASLKIDAADLLESKRIEFDWKPGQQ